MKHTGLVNAKSKSKSGPSGFAGVGHALCIDNRGYEASLERGKVYRVLRSARSLPSGWVRIVDESGEDYAFPEKRFVPLTLPPRAKRALATAS